MSTATIVDGTRVKACSVQCITCAKYMIVTVCQVGTLQLALRTNYFHSRICVLGIAYNIPVDIVHVTANFSNFGCVFFYCFEDISMVS